jgi:hypothetical protein
MTEQWEAEVRQAISAVLAFLIGIAGVWTLRAKDEKPYEFAERDGLWVHIKNYDQSFAAIKLTPAEQRVAVQKRDAIFEVLKNSKVLNPLKGVAVRAEKSVIGRAGRDGNVLTTGPVVLKVGMTIGHFNRNSKTGEIQPFTIEMPRIEIITNDIDTSVATWKANKLRYEELRDREDRLLFLEPYATATTDNGLKICLLDDWTEVVLITNGRPLWIPATREQFLQAMIHDAGIQLGKEKEDRLPGAPPLKESEYFAAQLLREYEKELAALLPADRQQPAYFAYRNDQPLYSGLARAGDPGARPVVMYNPDYLNRLLPRTAIQLIVCTYNYNIPFRSDETIHLHTGIALTMLNNLARHLEYDKLSALIDK